MLLCSCTLPESRADVPPRIDALGGTLVAVSLGCLVFGIISGPEYGWSSPVVVATLVVGFVVLAGFVVSRLRAGGPRLDGRPFRRRGLAARAAPRGGAVRGACGRVRAPTRGRR